MARTKSPEFAELKRVEEKKKRLNLTPLNSVRMYREAKHLTQSELADLCGVHRTTIARIEQQGCRPHRYLAEIIAEALEITVDQVYGTAVAPPYMDSSIFSPAKSGEYLCAFRRSGSHNFSYVVGYFDRNTQTWSLPPLFNQIDGDLPPNFVKYWTRLPEVVDAKIVST